MIHAYTYIHTYILTYYMRVHAYMHACINIYIYRNIHTFMHTYMYIHSQWRIQGGQIRPWPPSKLAMEFGPPPRGRQINDSIVNLWKCKDFGPRYRCRLRIWPPNGKIPH